MQEQAVAVMQETRSNEDVADDALAMVMEASQTAMTQQPGKVTPAMQLMRLQREAQGAFLMEIGSVLTALVDLVVNSSEEDRAAAADKAGPRAVDGSFMRVAVGRDLIERVFRLQLRTEVQAVRPRGMSSRDSVSVLKHVDNHRRGKVEFTSLQRPKTGYRPLQLLLMDISSKEECEEVVQNRRIQICTTLSDGYMRQRVSALRTWQHTCIECKGESPWRLHWPQDRGDDELMTAHLTLLSMRYTDFGPIEASKMHVIEFHAGFLKVTPPPFPLAEWTMSKIKRTIAQENPEGRKVRPGLLMAHVQAICADLWQLSNDSQVPLMERKFYVNCGSAIAATYSPALRTGESCPGTAWNSYDYWSRETIGGMMDEASLNAGECDGVIIQAMKRKTIHMSAVARQKANQPIVYDAKASHSAAFAKWGPLLQRIDPCAASESSETPAFREGGRYSLALSTETLREVLRAAAQRCNIADWADFDYGAHSLRIGRENAFRAANIEASVINDITSHTTTAGRQPYSRMQITDLVQASRKADQAVVKTLESVVTFGSNRGAKRAHVYTGVSGAVAAGTAVNQGSDKSGESSSDGSSHKKARSFFK